MKESRLKKSILLKGRVSETPVLYLFKWKLYDLPCRNRKQNICWLLVYPNYKIIHGIMRDSKCWKLIWWLLDNGLDKKWRHIWLLFGVTSWRGVCIDDICWRQIYTKTDVYIKVMTYNASLRHEFRVSMVRRKFKTRHYVILHVFSCHTFLLPVEIGKTCLTEARRLSPPLDVYFQMSARPPSQNSCNYCSCFLDI